MTMVNRDVRKDGRPGAEEAALRKRGVRKDGERPGAEELSDENLDQVSGGAKPVVDDTFDTVEGAGGGGTREG